MYHNEFASLQGIRFYDVDGNIIYESACHIAFCHPYFKKHEILLNEGEKIIGFVSTSSSLGLA